MRSSSPPNRQHAEAELPGRTLRILTSLVREYIDAGEPVSSLWLARHGGCDVSSATVRNTLAGLEELGYVRQPHTSAGRVPTDLGYRCYVNLLLRARRPAKPAPEVEARLRRARTVEDLLASASQELSRASHHLGFAFVCAGESTAFRHIEFVPLSETRVLVVLITAAGQVLQKAVDIGERVAGPALIQAANYLNREFAGLPLGRVRLEVLSRLREERALYDALLRSALRLARTTLEDLAPQTTLRVQGAARLLEQASEGAAAVSLATLRALFAMIEQKDRLVRLLNEYFDGRGLTVIIGAEHAAPELQDLSLVASTYRDEDGLGTVGVIGPRRMRYSRAIAAVDSVSSTVRRLFAAEEATT